jgi:hypothetical protein
MSSFTFPQGISQHVPEGSSYYFGFMLIVAEVFTCTKCESLWQSDAHSLARCLIECTIYFYNSTAASLYDINY